MQDIKAIIFSTISGDATFKTLTGATATDSRLYTEFPIKQVDKDISESLPWVTYSTITSSPLLDTGDIHDPDIIFIFDIWGVDNVAIEDVFDRIKVLLDRKEFNTADHRCLFTRWDAANDLTEERPGLNTLYHKNVRFKMVGVFQLT